MRWTRRSRPASLADLRRDYRAACDAEDHEREVEILVAITASYPDESWGWFDLGLRMKWLRDWPRCRDANRAALQLLDDPSESPEAWNLGIAATALGEWETARHAWTVFGIELPEGPPDEPIDGDFGLTPVRLNPDPRFGEPPLTISGVRYATEVVWATRLCPARARIENVPLPDSGHRRGDIVLHDGDPVGERRLGDSVRSVFNEIALLERGPHPTLTTIIDTPPAGELTSLADLFADAGFGLESWSEGVQLLCKACSEGSVDSAHDHSAAESVPRDTVTLGIAAPSADSAAVLLDDWLGARGLDRGPIAEAVAEF